mmetsp:Transcript_15299/g.35802  ORF Transcript_15299/g.35802 Transcript_15299/m.35802 type:complete len:335 (+) Transcript_15299:200-1204(+)
MWDRAAQWLLRTAGARVKWHRVPERLCWSAAALASGSAASVAAAGQPGFWRVLQLQEAPQTPEPPTPSETPATDPKKPEKPPDTPEPERAPAPEVRKPQEVPTKPATRRAAGSVNVDQEMLHLRRIFITGEINDDSAKLIVQQLFFLEAVDPDAPITVFINSGGGLVHSGLAILDVMTHLSTPLKTVAYGRCFSIAALLLAAGTVGQRSAYSNVRLMIHEASCSYPKLQCTDVVIKVDELKHTQRTMETILSARTGRTPAEIAAALQRDKYMSVQEAIDFGLIDSVVPATHAGCSSKAMSKSAEVPAGDRGSTVKVQPSKPQVEDDSATITAKV